MIEERISASDRFQVEFKSTYPLMSDQEHTSYTIEFYVFVPSSLGINADTYPKYLFYRDIQTYIRFKTPTALLRNMAGGENSPLRLLKESLDGLATGPDEEGNVKYYKNQNKMFCSIFRSAMRGHVKLLRESQDPSDVEPLVEEYLSGVRQVLSSFRKLRTLIKVPAVDEALFAIYEYSDEYLSLIVDQLTYEILEDLTAEQARAAKALQPQLLQLIDAETRYRKKRRYPSVASADSDNEELIYRNSVLRNYNQSILLLNTRMRPEGKIVEQVVYSLAAGLAMIFATAVAFYTQAKYGNFTMAFFVALVVSYMFKDRIKELVRTYLNNRVQRLFYDHKLMIYGGSGRRRLGFTRERFSFVAEKNLDAEIRKLRNPDRFRDIDNEYSSEQVMLYRKNIRLLSRNVEQLYQSHAVRAINDITRLNLARFVRRMEDPKKPVYVTHGEGYRKVRGSKVYHLNLVVKYQAYEDTSYARFRIVLNRRGIKRIESVAIN